MLNREKDFIAVFGTFLKKKRKREKQKEWDVDMIIYLIEIMNIKKCNSPIFDR